MNTIKHNGYIIDRETEDKTKKTIYTVWDKKGIIWLGTFYSLESAKKFAESRE